MTTINKYNQSQWLGMKALKSQIEFMQRSNVGGVFDNALAKQIPVFKYFLRGDEYRKELPDEEDDAEAAA